MVLEDFEPKERIEMCLNCKKPKCTNCLGNSLGKYKVKQWTEEEKQYVLTHTIEESMEFTGRPKNQVRCKIFNLKKNLKN